MAYDDVMVADLQKNILVQFGEHSRPISIPPHQNLEVDKLKERVKTVFKDVIAETEFFLQLKDDEWGGSCGSGNSRSQYTSGCGTYYYM